MRALLTLCLGFGLTVLTGCCCGGQATTARAYTPSGSSSEPVMVKYKRTPRVEVREVSRPSYEHRIAEFTPPAAPELPVARRTARAASPKAVPLKAVPVKAEACAPAASERCVGGNCGIPSLDCCEGGNCGIPSLNDVLGGLSSLNPCK